MKTTLLVVLLLVTVLTVSARRSGRPGRNGSHQQVNGCQVPNCNKCQTKPYLCDECGHGFVRQKVPLGYACVKKQSYECPQNCKSCQNRFSCSVCESGLVLYKGMLGLGMGRCIKTCPRGFKTEVNTTGGNKCVKQCTPNCRTCQGRSCSVCEEKYALLTEGLGRWGGRCVQKCPRGYKTEMNPSGGNQCVRPCTQNCKTCQGRSCSVCEKEYALLKGLGGWGGRCVKKCPRGFKTEVIVSGGNQCVRPCTPNCKTCQGRSCSVCEGGYALYKGFGGWGSRRCLQKCPRGFKTDLNPSGGNQCIRQCTPNCKTCRGRFSCSVCESGHALHKAFGFGRCTERCPEGYTKEVNPKGGDQCVKPRCQVKECESCPITWVPQHKCTRCKPGYYKLSVGKPWQARDFCFSHCPAGYVPKTVKGIAVCQLKPATEEPTPEPEWTTAEPEPMTTEEPTTEPDDTTTTEPTMTTEPSTPVCDTEPFGSEPTTIPEPMTEPEPTAIFTDFWP